MKTRNSIKEKQSGSLNDLTYGKCLEKGCKQLATKDYNGHGHYICNYHYDKLSDEFDEEYR